MLNTTIYLLTEEDNFCMFPEFLRLARVHVVLLAVEIHCDAPPLRVTHMEIRFP